MTSSIKANLIDAKTHGSSGSQS